MLGGTIGHANPNSTLKWADDMRVEEANATAKKEVTSSGFKQHLRLRLKVALESRTYESSELELSSESGEFVGTATDPRFDVLVGTAGLLPQHVVVDAGCGWGRLGLRLISYLDRARYHGVDIDEFSLRAFVQFEIGIMQPKLIAKAPTVLHSDQFAFRAALRRGAGGRNGNGSSPEADMVIFSSVYV